jgi:proteasome lid subunit RPN8/RPN11
MHSRAPREAELAVTIMKLRIEEQSWKQLCEKLLTRTDVESAGLLFGEPVQTPTGMIIVVRETVVLADDAYRIRRSDQISLDPIALNRLTHSARDRGWSVFTIHTHPGASEPWFSAADDAGMPASCSR